MIIKDSREEELLTKQGGGAGETKHRTSTRLWSALRNPRIVRVSKAFGGKDRHSKVSTIRGLRDRRVRLSVPTAIQLYDLQDKLGLNQPSKVVDWLLNAAQLEIDKLPPLPRAPGDFIELLNPQAWASASSIDASNGKSISNGQAFSGDAEFSNNVAEDVAAFHGSAYWASEKGNTAKAQHVMDDAMACTAFHQFEPPHSYAHVSHVGNSHSQVELPQGFLLASPSLISLMPGSQLMPEVFSSHSNSHSHLQMPSTFAQLLALNSSKAFLPSGRQHEREQ